MQRKISKNNIVSADKINYNNNRKAKNGVNHMAKSEKQKLKLLYIMQCLTEKTDAEHAVTTQEIIDYIIYAKEKGCSMQGMQDTEIEYLYVLSEK